LTSPGKLAAKEAQRMRRLRRRLARAQKGSNRRARVKTAIARLKARDVDRRSDWVEKTFTDLARRFDVIRVQDPHIAGMTRSARGTIAGPGRAVLAKAGLNRGILAGGKGALFARREDKAPGRVEKVNPEYTSQTRNACKQIARESRKNQADFKSVVCGHPDDADVKAARNIAKRAAMAGPAGLAVATRGDRVRLARSVKGEPQLVAS
jgi:putative transposase